MSNKIEGEGDAHASSIRDVHNNKFEPLTENYAALPDPTTIQRRHNRELKNVTAKNPFMVTFDTKQGIHAATLLLQQRIHCTQNR